MERLWAAVALAYITGDKTDGCIFCEFAKEKPDEERVILARGKTAYVIMNAFPYSNGHLLIAPLRHIGGFDELNDDENLEIMRLGQKCCKVLAAVCRPDGFNIGWNIGTAAGAGIAGHIHMHVVPRWNGDTNFMTVLGDVKVIPEDLDTMYKKLKAEFDTLAE